MSSNGRNNIRKKTKTEGSGRTTPWSEHHQTAPNQCKGGGPMVKGFAEGVVWCRGKKAYFQYLATTSFGRCFVGMTSLPKRGGRRWGPFDACQRGK